MIISEYDSASRNLSRIDQSPKDGDLINMAKFNSLPSPVTARMFDGGEWWIETLDVRTGFMRLDIWGQIDLECFSMVERLIDYNNDEHNPDEFWLDYDEALKGE